MHDPPPSESKSMKILLNPGEQSKTFKTQPRAPVLTQHEFDEMIHEAWRFVRDGNPEGYTRVEFKYGDCYFVIAKLKEKAE